MFFRPARSSIASASFMAADASAGPWNPALRRYEPAVLHALLLEAGFAEATVEEDAGGPQVAIAHA